MTQALAPIGARMTDSGVFAFVALDDGLQVVAVEGDLAGDARPGDPASEAFPYLAGYEDRLTGVATGDVAAFLLENISLAEADAAAQPVFVTVRAFANDSEAGGVFVLVEDTTRAAEVQARVIQQHNELALAQAELRKARDAAEAANRSKTAFLANISHELRTPLNVIIGNAELLARDPVGRFSAGELSAFVRDIHDSGVFLLDLISDLLDLSKAEAGRFELIEDHIDLTRLIEDCARLARGLPAASRRTIEVAPPADADHADLWGDEKRLRQIVINLLSNAVKFTAAGGNVQLSHGRAPDGGVTVEVVDDGVGMAAEELARIGAPFVSGRSSTNGVGLGLAIVKTLTELHGGALTIESAPGEGTRVRIRFPPERTRRR